MNKKFLIFGLLGVLGIGLVSAITYYAVFSASFNVLPSVSLTGNLEQSFGNVYSGETILGDLLILNDEAPTERSITFTNDAGSEIEVSYLSELELSQKIVNFSSNVWELTGDKAVIRYTLIGNEFNAEVVNGSKAGYVLIYYKDNSDRFNSPAQVINLNDINSNLPYLNDSNAEEYNYCDTGEYLTCQGAKIWYVPTTAIESGGNINWGRASEFLFETSLVQYSKGSIILYPGQNLKVIPSYKVLSNATGEITITTQII